MSLQLCSMLTLQQLPGSRPTQHHSACWISGVLILWLASKDGFSGFSYKTAFFFPGQHKRASQTFTFCRVHRVLTCNSLEDRALRPSACAKS